MVLSDQGQTSRPSDFSGEILVKRTPLFLAALAAVAGFALPTQLVGGGAAPAAAAPQKASTECLATITKSSGVAWRPDGSCVDPGYTNTKIPANPALNSAETKKIRALPSAILNIDAYTEPIYFRTTRVALRTVSCIKYGCVGGSSAPLTGKEHVAPGSDAQLVLVDRQRRRTYEMYQVATDPDGTVKINQNGSVTVGSMSVVDLDGRGNKTADNKNLNITGAGVSRLFGVIRAHEIQAAATRPATAIPHALQVSLPKDMNCSRAFREPATKTDGRSTSTDCVEEGARVQLDPAYDCERVPSRMGQAVCATLQDYGAYVMDNNGSTSMAIYAQHRKSWATGVQDYAAAGIKGDYQNLGIPMSQLHSLASWSGR
jgi:hypothetical protein